MIEYVGAVAVVAVVARGMVVHWRRQMAPTESGVVGVLVPPTSIGGQDSSTLARRLQQDFSKDSK